MLRLALAWVVVIPSFHLLKNEKKSKKKNLTKMQNPKTFGVSGAQKACVLVATLGTGVTTPVARALSSRNSWINTIYCTYWRRILYLRTPSRPACRHDWPLCCQYNPPPNRTPKPTPKSLQPLALTLHLRLIICQFFRPVNSDFENFSLGLISV